MLCLTQIILMLKGPKKNTVKIMNRNGYETFGTKLDSVSDGLIATWGSVVSAKSGSSLEAIIRRVLILSLFDFEFI